MKIRPAGSFHTFAEAIEKCVEIPATMYAVRAHAEDNGWDGFDNLTVTFYANDYRPGWHDTYLVSLDGMAAFFTDGPVPV